MAEFPSRLRYVDVSYENSEDSSRQKKVLKGLARCIYAMLDSVTQTESDKIFIWNHLRESGLVEDLLGVERQMSADLREIVLACNAAPNHRVRKQILSTIVKNYTYAQLNKFNEKPETIDDDEEPDEWIHVDPEYYYVEYIVSGFAISHAIVAFFMVIAYYNLKVPLGIFKREKEVGRRVEFDGLYLAEQVNLSFSTRS